MAIKYTMLDDWSLLAPPLDGNAYDFGNLTCMNMNKTSVPCSKASVEHISLPEYDEFCCDVCFTTCWDPGFITSQRGEYELEVKPVNSIDWIMCLPLVNGTCQLYQNIYKCAQ